MRIGKRLVWLLVSSLMVISLVLASCAPTEEEEEEEVIPPTEEEEEEEVTPPTGDWWDKFGEPEYGGTFSFAPARWATGFDPNSGAIAEGYGAYMFFLESLFIWDWTLDRDEWSFPGPWGPQEVYAGCLVESWEQPDAQTVILHIREGIRWWDKPPLNGRELTAYDIQYHFDRFLGTGSGFTERGPTYNMRFDNWKQCVATDKYTAVFTFNNPTAVGLQTLMEMDGARLIEPREVIDQYGNMDDWQTAVGTGPWILTDYVASSSMTFIKNPNYWGYDERYPENKLPYADSLRQLCIPDISTRMAAMRSGKADLTCELDWEQAASLMRTNPELQEAKLPYMAYDVVMRVDLEPWSDIRVRKALEMAIDRETIAATHYGGTLDGTPCGWVNPALKGYAFPYEEWPQELKDEYSYNPERAMELLEEAGHPDGIKCELLAASNVDLDLIQIIQAEFKDIGVDMSIKVMEAVAQRAAVNAGDYELVWDRFTASTASPHTIIVANYSTSFMNSCKVNDPVFDAMCDELNAMTVYEDTVSLIKQMDRYLLEQHWSARIFGVNTYNVWQPWLKGYDGENLLRTGMPGGWPWARWWIDHDLKESMGY